MNEAGLRVYSELWGQPVLQLSRALQQVPLKKGQRMKTLIALNLGSRETERGLFCLEVKVG